ncbi:hypothetical protein M422DRAFT_251761 [Sphaerobolus stellatus SS14]|uniref:F-box domain-containing protein n=1 Tax=Sphaerobolus stellatus (strain SS14) TaxID=990650 RepID=A0A0C9VQZ4_SPHS4|nr:hypothetical protein M422DRAFT_251761 [Sphaerobolus stellatus SS14]
MLTNLPDELLDEILFYVNSEHDLISLALTCKRISRQVNPSNLDFRTIEGTFAGHIPNDLWKDLVGLPRLYQRKIRKIRLEKYYEHNETRHDYEDNKFHLPASLRYAKAYGPRIEEDMIESTRYLVNAIHHLDCLVEFRWSCSTLTTLSLLRLLSHSAPLLECFNVMRSRGADVCLNDKVSLPAVNRTLNHLTEITFGCDRQSYTDEPEVLEQIMNIGPNVEGCSVIFTDPYGTDVDYFFESTSSIWPELTTFEIIF